MDFVFKMCEPDDIGEILDIQRETIALLTDKSMLRNNSVEMLERCLCRPNITLGAWSGDILAGFFVLYFPEEDEALAPYLSFPTERVSANSKLCIVRPAFRGNGLQVRLGEKVEKYARDAGVQLLCATISPDNIYSARNAVRLGFKKDRRIEKYGSVRDLYYKFI